MPEKDFFVFFSTRDPQKRVPHFSFGGWGAGGRNSSNNKAHERDYMADALPPDAGGARSPPTMPAYNGVPMESKDNGDRNELLTALDAARNRVAELEELLNIQKSPMAKLASDHEERPKSRDQNIVQHSCSRVFAAPSS